MSQGRTRFLPRAADALRQEIREAGGVEVFAICRLDPGGMVCEVEVHCRGTDNAVPALLRRPKPGEVVVHNHPSGILKASDADMALAGLYGDDGIGVAIVNNEVTEVLWVVEPHARRIELVFEDEVRAFFLDALPRALGPAYEPRPTQVAMALAVAARLNDGGVALLEAGTGTGKSLAYLVPAVIWATKNDARVAIATFTHNLQAQLATSDIPLVKRAGLDFTHAVVKGRNNYLCRRQLAEALHQSGGGLFPTEDARTLRALDEWSRGQGEGTRADLGFAVESDLWERVGSDHDKTLRVRCKHYDSCFYYEARRRAAAARILVLNHHLVLADAMVRAETGGEGVLPGFDRLVVDEAHHLEDAATSMFRAELGLEAVRRAVGPLLPRKRGPGALEQLAGFHASQGGPLRPESQAKAARMVDELHRLLADLRDESQLWFATLAAQLSPQEPQLRITQQLQQQGEWTESIEPTVREAGRKLGQAADAVAKLEHELQGLPKEAVDQEPQPVFDLARARRRLTGQAAVCDGFLQVGPDNVRWISERKTLGVINHAPIEVGPTLRQHVFESFEATIGTSATLTVGNNFMHLLERLGLSAEPVPDVDLQRFASPFDYPRQVLLALPRDLPEPGDRGYDEDVARVLVEALELSGGGAFVLCTSYRAVDALHAAAGRALGDRMTLLKQGEMGRARLLERFKTDTDSVLFGTDSFWEGVSVSGDSLRLVVIPRLPFRVPTEPVQQARHERIEALGRDPFRTYALPQAVLRFRQGFGRLIRTNEDRGVVLVLDTRVTRKPYGRVFLASLPPLGRATGPWSSVKAQIEAFYAQG